MSTRPAIPFPPSSNPWGIYLHRDGAATGPIGEEQIGELIRTGELVPETLVWRPGLADWSRASDVPGLFTPPPSPRAHSEAIHSARATEPETHPSPTESQSRSYIGRHWRGELTLEKSFFLNTLGLTALLGIAFAESVEPLSWSRWGIEHPRSIACAVIVGAAFSAVVAVWQVVGTWRCANRYQRARERALLRILVRNLLVIGVIGALGRFYGEERPFLKDALAVVRGDPQWPPPKLAVLGDGSVLQIEGALRTGIADEAEEALRSHPAVTSVSIEGPGGRMGEAFRLFEMFARRKLHVHATGNCESGCAIAFAGGQNRTANPSTRFGFHAAGLPAPGGNGVQWAQAESARVTRRLLVQAGVAETLIVRILATPNGQMLRPPLGDLVAAGYLHRIVEASDEGDREEAYRAKQVLGPTVDHKAGPELSPKDDAPPARKLADAGHADARRPQGDLWNSAALSEWATEFVTSGDLARNFGRIPDKEMLDLVKAQLNALRQVRARSVDTCARAAKEPTSAQIAPHLTTEARDTLNHALVKAYFASTRVPQPFRTPADFDAQASKLLERVAQREPAASRILANPGAPQASSKELCDFQIALMEELLKLPKSKAAAVWRSSQTTE